MAVELRAGWRGVQLSRQFEMQGTVENRSSLSGGVAFDTLWCWKDDNLQTSEYSLQYKYKGTVTNTTENVKTIPPVSCFWNMSDPPSPLLDNLNYLLFCHIFVHSYIISAIRTVDTAGPPGPGSSWSWASCSSPGTGPSQSRPGAPEFEEVEQVEV